jgi:hypothetical protein
MKSYLTSIFFFITLQTICGQARIIPKYVEADPIWLNKVVNDNYPSSPSSSEDSLGSHIFIDMIEIENFIYTLFYTSDPEPNRPPNGYIISKTHKLTGQVMWTDVNTPFTGSPGSLFAQNIRIRNDQNIEIIADRKVDFNSGNIKYYPLSYRRVYDHESGQILGTYNDKEDKATLGSNNTFKYAKYHCVQEDSIYLAHYSGILLRNDTYYQTLRIGQLNGKMDKTQDTIAILFDRDVPLGFGFHQAADKYSWTLNDSTIVWYTTYYSNDTMVYKNKARLLFIDIKDLKNIHIRKKLILEDKLDIRNGLFRTKSNLTLKNDQIFITNENYYEETKDYQHNILHLDADGNELGHYKGLKRNGLPYNFISVLKTTDSLTYFIGVRVFTEHQNDLFTIDRLGQYNLVTTITTKDDKPEHYFAIRENSCLLTKEDFLIYGGAYNQRNPIKYTILMQGFELKSLIEGTMVGADDINQNECPCVEVFPNPTNDLAELRFDSPFSGQIMITDIQGTTLFSTKINSELTTQLDLSAYPKGLYFIGFFSGSNKESIRPIKLLKL